MISEFLLKGIDNLFQDKLAMSRPQGRPVFSRETIKRDLSSVIRTKEVQHGSPSPVKKSNLHRNLQHIQQEFNVKPEQEEPQPELTKSRLKAFLENDRENKLKSVIRKADGRSRTPTKNVPTVNYAEQTQQEVRRPTQVYNYKQQLSYSPAPAYNQREPEEAVQPWQHPEPRKAAVHLYNAHNPSHNPPQL